MEMSWKRAEGCRGLWNNPRSTPSSKEDQDMLRLRKEESLLRCQQRNQINTNPKHPSAKASLSKVKIMLSPSPPASHQTSEPSASSSVNKSVQMHLTRKSQRRSAECCRSWSSYEREKFRPGPTRDLEKEKKRLQSILATGSEESSATSAKPAARCESEVTEETDRYQEVLKEIEERRQFLAEMAALGQERRYINIINTEISQKIRELELLDQDRRSK